MNPIEEQKSETSRTDSIYSEIDDFQPRSPPNPSVGYLNVHEEDYIEPDEELEYGAKEMERRIKKFKLQDSSKE
jgi:hypothetical protein